MNSEIPQAILKKHPELLKVSEALEAYRKGQLVQANCAICESSLSVEKVKATGVLWVGCVSGCTNFRALWRKPLE